MAHYFRLRAALPLLIAFLLSPLFAGAQTPLISNPLTSYWNYGNGTTIAVANDSGPGFTQCLKAAVTGTSAFTWDAGIGWNTIAAVNAGDNLTVTFWVRKLSPLDGNIIRAKVGFQLGTMPYTKELYTVFPCDGNLWTKYSIPFKAANSYAAGTGQLIIQMAYGPQSFEIGGIMLVNNGPTPGLPAGTNVLPATIYGYNGGTGGTSIANTISVTGMPFTQAYRFTTYNNAANVWDYGYGWTNAAALTQNDNCVLRFWARKISPSDGSPIKAQVVFEQNGGSYEKSLLLNYPADQVNTWILYSLPFKVSRNYGVGGAHLVFQYGFGPQQFDVGGITLLNYGQNIANAQLPYAFYYPGRDTSAAWRASADSRLDQYRKGDLTVIVKDKNGVVLPNATVYVQQIGHAFKFGSALTAQNIAGATQDLDIYRSRITSHFTTSVLENDLKWPFWEGWQSWDRQATLDAIAWLAGNSIPVRGHNLIWPSYGNMPSDTPGLSASALQTRINNHFSDILNNTGIKGKLYEWDVINEPYDNYDVQGHVGGVAGVPQSNGVLGNYEMVNWFNLAHSLDPNARLFVNDYNILEAGGADTRHQDYFYAVAQYLLSNNAPLDSLGIQGHWGPITPIPLMQTIIDRFSALPVNLAMTEFDVNTLDESLQADYTRDVMTEVFSNPKFTDFVMWGFWENAHWLPAAALYRADWTSKPNALAYTNLLYDTWFTNVSGTSDATGKYTARGFKGGYNVAAAYGGVANAATVTLDAANSVTITLNVGQTTATLNPTADAYVRDGGGAGQNFGAANPLNMKTGGTGYNRWGYAKFDTSSATGSVVSAKLRFYAALSGTQNTNVLTNCFAVSNTAWTESALTWNNKPAFGSTLGSFTVANTTYAWYEVDVTGYLQSERAAGRPLIAFGLKNPATTDAVTNIKSKEDGTSKPQLVLVTQ